MKPLHRQRQANEFKNVAGYINCLRTALNKLNLVTQLFVMVAKFQQHGLPGIYRLIILVKAPVTGLLNGTQLYGNPDESLFLIYPESNAFEWHPLRLSPAPAQQKTYCPM